MGQCRAFEFETSRVNEKSQPLYKGKSTITSIWCEFENVGVNRQMPH